MTQSIDGKQLGLVGLLLVGALVASGEPAIAQNQIVPDNTLGGENSTVTPDVINGVESDRIDGGAQRGANLFHSFRDFNVSEGRGAYFANPTGIENILSRVTGGNASNILGTLGVLGEANLFLINPKGIIFGPNARLDVGGSFVGTTADSVVFGDNFEFSASNPQAPPLLTVNVPLGLQYGNNAGSIQVQGNGQGIRTSTNLIDTNEALRVGSDETLALVGGEVYLEGAALKTAGGRIELGSIDSPDLISLTPIDKGWALGYENVQSFRNIQLSQQAAVDASGLGAGDIQVRGKQIILTNGSQIEASTLAEKSGGSLIVNASKSIEMIGKSPNIETQNLIGTTVYPSATGDGASIQIDTELLRIADGGQVNASTFGEGNAGNLFVRAQFIELIGQVASVERNFLSGLYSVVQPRDKTGALQPLAKTGDGGNIQIDAEQLRVADGAQISAYTIGEGNAGNISIRAQSIELTGETLRSGLSPQASGLSAQVGLPSATGDGGNLQIITEQLRVADGAIIIVSTFGKGNAGDLISSGSIH